MKPLINFLTATLFFWLNCSVLRALDVPPALASASTQYRNETAAIEQQKAASVARSQKTYTGALLMAEKTATLVGDLHLLGAISKERNSLKPDSDEGSPPKDFPKDLLASRKAYLAAVSKANSEASAKMQRTAANYVRTLTALESRSTGDAQLLGQIAKEKERIIKETPVDLTALTSRLTGTSWIYGGFWVSLKADGVATRPGGDKGRWKVVGNHDLEFRWDGYDAVNKATLVSEGTGIKFSNGEIYRLKTEKK